MEKREVVTVLDNSVNTIIEVKKGLYKIGLPSEYESERDKILEAIDYLHKAKILLSDSLRRTKYILDDEEEIMPRCPFDNGNFQIDYWHRSEGWGAQIVCQTCGCTMKVEELNSAVDCLAALKKKWNQRATVCLETSVHPQNKEI